MNETYRKYLKTQNCVQGLQKHLQRLFSWTGKEGHMRDCDKAMRNMSVEATQLNMSHEFTANIHLRKRRPDLESELLWIGLWLHHLGFVKKGSIESYNQRRWLFIYDCNSWRNQANWGQAVEVFQSQIRLEEAAGPWLLPRYCVIRNRS